MSIIPSCILNLFSLRYAKVFCSLFLSILGMVFPMHSQAGTELMGDPLKFLSTLKSEILNIDSKEEALQVFLQSNPSLISQIRIRQTRKETPVRIQLPSDVQEAITQIMAGLVALQTAQNFLTTHRESHSVHQDENLTPIQPARYQWMADTPIYEKLSALIILEGALSSLQSAQAPSMEGADEQYRQFEQYLDTQLPASAEGAASWTHLLKEQGVQGLQNRLEEFRGPLQSSPNEKQPSPADITRFRKRYIHSRLLPRFQAYLHHDSIELQNQAYKILLTQGPFIAQWQEQEEKQSTLARLCGSWLWTLHNHQNHQDHKMTVNFLPPGESALPNQPTPSTVAIHGDTVYVEWIFPQGRQEDSLLLSNRDSIMEGTFKSTLGPYGSITGKRLSSCKP